MRNVDTTQDILFKVFNADLSTFQVTLKGSGAISLGAVRIMGTASAVIEGTTTYGLEVDVTRIPSTVQKDVSLIQQDMSAVQDDVSVVKNNVSVMREDTSVMQDDISVMQNNISVMQNQVSAARDLVSIIASAIRNPDIGKIRQAGTWTTAQHGVRSAISTAAVQVAHATIAMKRGMLCRAHDDNTTMVYVGVTNVTGEAGVSTCGYPLEAEKSVLLELDRSSKVHAIANAANQKLHYMAI